MQTIFQYGNESHAYEFRSQVSSFFYETRKHGNTKVFFTEFLWVSMKIFY
jgi:hypothetical protein